MLPERLELDVDLRGTEPATSSRAGRTTPPERCRVLLVDDEPLVRARLGALLKSADYQVDAASSAREALGLLRETPADIVLTDWRMPGMDGMALCRQIRAMQHDHYVYLVMLSVKDSQKDQMAGLAAGADDYLVKGAPVDEIMARLDIGRRITHWNASHVCLIDPVSGAYTGEYLARHLPREFARAERYGHPLAIATCEVGDLAADSDGYRLAPVHDGLRSFVARAAGCLRASDWIARTGENEFLIVLPETGLRGAYRVAEKLREAMVAAPEEDERTCGYSFDIDVTAMEPHRHSDSKATLAALLRAASRIERPARRNADNVHVAKFSSSERVHEELN